MKLRIFLYTKDFTLVNKFEIEHENILDVSAIEHEGRIYAFRGKVQGEMAYDFIDIGTPMKIE